MKQRQYFSIHTPVSITQDVYITLMVLILYTHNKQIEAPTLTEAWT